MYGTFKGNKYHTDTSHIKSTATIPLSYYFSSGKWKLVKLQGSSSSLISTVMSGWEAIGERIMSLWEETVSGLFVVGCVRHVGSWRAGTWSEWPVPRSLEEVRMHRTAGRRIPAGSPWAERVNAAFSSFSVGCVFFLGGGVKQLVKRADLKSEEMYFHLLAARFDLTESTGILLEKVMCQPWRFLRTPFGNICAILYFWQFTYRYVTCHQRLCHCCLHIN